ncbi:hypothetical protein DPMN_099151 [Dreissena polymorpha]|uniref:Uncharacterized protein n=1 Tax=Dreissena polymorpha TaxID=45954 RepID=A0A9D4R7Y0_DREPO|nr:hypothetical protein DPMN_099151 [Dreissena polymorpha]
MFITLHMAATGLFKTGIESLGEVSATWASFRSLELLQCETRPLCLPPGMNMGRPYPG